MNLEKVKLIESVKEQIHPSKKMATLLDLLKRHEDITPHEAEAALNLPFSSMQSILSLNERQGLLKAVRRVCRVSGVRRFAYSLSGQIPEFYQKRRSDAELKLERLENLQKARESRARNRGRALIESTDTSALEKLLSELVDLNRQLLNVWTNQEKKDAFHLT